MSELEDDDLAPQLPLLRRAYSYGTIEDEEREAVVREISFGAATDISDISESDLAEMEKFDLLESTENVRRWFARPVLLPSTSDLGALDPVTKRRRSAEEWTPMSQRRRQTTGDSRLKTREKLTLAMLAMANLFSIVVYSCIAPFFPGEAKRKGASETEIGFLFGMFELIIVLVAPLFGRYLTQLGSKFTFGCGLFVTGATSILFGFLNFSPPGPTFITLCFLVRSVEAVADAAFVTASFAIAASSFPTRVATVIGLLETFSGLGYTVGPPLGGALYQLGGFSLPFWVLGSILLGAGVFCVYLIPKQKDTPRDPVGNIFGLMTNIRTCIMMFLVFVSNASFAFLDPTLEPFLTTFEMTPLLVGLMFLLPGGFYTAAAPVWGYLTDRKHCAQVSMLIGSLFAAIAFFFIGPSPVLSIDKRLWLVALTLIIHGTCVGAQMIPPFQQCLVEARKQGYPDTFETYGLVSSLFQVAVSLGAFFGSTVGSIAVEHFGFGWTSTAVAVLNLLCVLALIFDMIYTRKKRRSAVSSQQNGLLKRVSSCSLR